MPAVALTCKDGFSVSVQASTTHYCSPRNYEGPYDKFELGFPSMMEPLLMPYAEDAEEPTCTVYGYVPLEVVLQVINLHGGVKLAPVTSAI